MEVSGLVVGVAGLLGTFSACLECFELVRVGRRTGTDYETSIIKLDHVRLRFSRWGEAVGLVHDDEATAMSAVKSNLQNPETDYTLIERTMSQILELFEKSLKTSIKQKPRDSQDAATEASESIITNRTVQHIHESIQKLARARQKMSALSRKVSWALYRKRDLNELIEDLTELVTDLTTLAPPQRQEELCVRELSVMDDDQAVAMLNTVLAEPVGETEQQLDSALRKEVERIIEERRGTMDSYTWINSHLDEGARVHQGTTVESDYQGTVSDRPATYRVEDSTFGKNSKFHQGTQYGSKR